MKFKQGLVLLASTLMLAGCMSAQKANKGTDTPAGDTGVFKTRTEAIEEALASVGAESQDQVSDLEVAVSDDGTGYVVTFTFDDKEHSVLVDAAGGTRALEERIHFDDGVSEEKKDSDSDDSEEKEEFKVDEEDDDDSEE